MAFIIANGEFSASQAQLQEISKTKYLIAVDGGIDHCIRHKFRPQLLVGDFDSVSQASLDFFHDVPRLTLSQDKDETDLEAALKKAHEHTKGPIRVFGALGARSDHFLYNLYLLSRYKGQVTLESEKETILLLEKKQTISCHPGQTISFLPLNGPVKEVTTKGLKWDLQEATFDKNWMSISNIAESNTIQISHSEGDLLCILEN